MWHKMKSKTAGAIAAALALCLVFLLSAGCGTTGMPAPTSTPAQVPTAAPEPAPTPAEDEEIVYVPKYEVYPPAMHSQSGFTAEREDSVWLLCPTDSGEGSRFCLMRGDAEARVLVSVAFFDPDVWPLGMCITEEGRAWLYKISFETWEYALLEISTETGELLREIPFPTEYGAIGSIFDLPDGALGISAEAETERCIFRLEEDGSFSRLSVIPDEDERGHIIVLGADGSGLPDGECMACDEKGLIAVDPLTGARRELMCWADWGIGYTIVPLGQQDGIVRLLDYGYEEVVTITPTPRSRVKPRQELAMSCLTLDDELEKAVRDFNRRSGEWYITVRDYSGGQELTRDVRDRAITAMNLDIVNGSMPDLLAIQDGVPFRSWAEKGFLRDLRPWLEAEHIELLPQLSRAGTVDGRLLMVCGSFAVLTAAGNRDVIGDPSGWTAAEASALAASLPDCRRVFTGQMTRDKYLELLDAYLEGYLDWDGGTASFDSPGFRDVLAFAAALPAEEEAESSADAEIMHGWALVDAVTVESVRDWQLWDLTYMGNLVCPGIPASDGVGSLIRMRSPMAVSAVSAHPEGACAFLRSLLDEKAQTASTGGFPSLQAAFEAQLADAMREPGPEEGYHITYITADGFRMEESLLRLWDDTEDRRIPRGIVRWYDVNFTLIREEKLYAMSEAQRDSLLALLDGAVRSASYDQVIAGIVHEEAGAYFAGQRSADEVSRRIRRRVELYLAEQG